MGKTLAKPGTMSTGVWAPVKSDTLSAQITQQMRQALFAGQIQAGEPIGSEKTLAARFGVSRMAIRDALRSLEAAGIVEIKKGAKGGVFIAHGNPFRFADALAIQLKLVGVSIEEMFDAQIALEVTAAEFAARRATPEDLAQLRGFLAQMQDLAKAPLTSKGAQRFTEISMQFHEALVGVARNRVISAQFGALRLVLEPIYARRTSDTVAKTVMASHAAIINAIAEQDSERASTLMRKRLESIRAHQLLTVVGQQD